MSQIKKLLAVLLVLGLAAGAGFAWWAQHPMGAGEETIDFSVAPGSGVGAAAQQIAAAGVPLQPLLFQILARISGSSARIKAGTYEFKPGSSPARLLEMLVKGEFAQGQVTIIEGWTFRQMRAAINAAKGLKHDTANLSDQELLAQVSDGFKHPEGLFFPDTYIFPKGSSDLVVYKQAHQMLTARLNEAWQKRPGDLPYKSPYEALIMASIVEKETGQKSERPMIASVFVNRLKIGMMLQTDPTVIYGMGDKYQGKIRKKDLETDTPYNTYTRGGLPPTPIALPGMQSLTAALGPAKSNALYFVARGDGTSQFSSSLSDHNRAVDKYIR
ncbi:endolytic transglycosylase MltG [Massilia sp. TS11]|uniref:endolytic transglycosylase MltG n=1 Tax=Massilia sp. TS11 TaxID=2908003 RepID=UPI001EDC4BE8|nr:endolytic transglycosylase MltG [Massilia sp. TS11]MCG2584707.1 endolytic transglycosylase MltG [Massilia sp. TS11]